MNPIPQQIKVRYPNRRAVLCCCKLDGTSITLFVPSRAMVNVGARVFLSVSVDNDHQVFNLVGNVTWCRKPVPKGVNNPGFGVHISSEEKEPAVKFLAFCANRPAEQGTAQERRFPTSLSCKVINGSYRIPAHICDLSASGAFVGITQISRIREGSEITLKLATGFLGIGDTVLRAKVIWRGKKGDQVGFGARFVSSPAYIRQVLRKQFRGDPIR